MMNRLILFLIRRKLHLKKYEKFKFSGQKQEGIYYFNSNMLVKKIGSKKIRSGVSLNYLLSNEVEITKIK